MQVPLQITVRNMTPSATLDARIREKAEALERFQPHITGCRVTVAGLGNHRRHGGPFEVRVEVRVPARAMIIASRQHVDDVFVALRDAFDSATRQLGEAFEGKRTGAEASGNP
jgi:ribosomal subunit interface protein